jgi:N-acetylmuramoyl-L-alanine amidase
VNLPFLKLSPAQVLALTIYGEARGEPTEGKIAVGSVILERVKQDGWYGKTIPEVCFKKWQFSCYLENDPNYGKLLNIAEHWDEAMIGNKALNDCFGIALGLVNGTILPTVEATNYKTLTCDAAWAVTMKKVATVGNHDFYMA